MCLLRANNYEQLELTSVEIKQANDEILLAYLDGEMSMARIRAIRNHLKICWKCRSVLADLESQAKAISRHIRANCSTILMFERTRTGKQSEAGPNRLVRR